MRTPARLFAPALLLVAAACHHGGQEEDQTPQPDLTPVRVEVTNNFALPVDIYASGQGISHRLGTVHPGMNSSFDLPQVLIGNGSAELEARPANDDRMFRSGPLLLSPGAFVKFVVSPQVFSSTVQVRAP